MAKQVQCNSIGVSVKFGNVTCYDDGSIVVEGPAVLWVSKALMGVDGRSRKVGAVQRAIMDAISRGLHTREEIAASVGISIGSLGYSLTSLVRKGLVMLVKATSGGPCRSYYFLPGQDIQAYLTANRLVPCRKSS
ncbi:hypothetical protein ASAC_0595 [Acidilobus saccharovorans 345-15]|uniref:Uncharacterized protein n=1 Tax=Acidilobus saccharovorans (strain DSM 16705 / JCM 18335 / VKM B-2471 / 345-15) TaxID=666510 RepID=D9Q114_ACIS3|nr:hypothetical protein [Acidilobus saccharovorans]ADL19002.1 hypothetical protein ASAC_0595 [Acidilobus saccharovorans 345-15]